MQRSRFARKISKVYAVACLLSVCAANYSFADNARGFYLGLGGSSVENRLDAVETSRLTFNELIGGYKYNNALGVEVRLGSALQPAKTSQYPNGNSFTKMERDISTLQALYYRAELVNEEARLYGLLGYSRLTSQLRVMDSQGKTASTTDQNFSGLSYGIGVGFILSDEINLNFEARALCKDLDNKQNSLGINLDYRF